MAMTTQAIYRMGEFCTDTDIYAGCISDIPIPCRYRYPRPIYLR